MKQFRRWLFKTIFGFDIFDYCESQARLLDTLASAVATTFMEKNEQDGEFIDLTTKAVISQQEQITDIQKAITAVLKTLTVHQNCLNKIAESYSQEPEEPSNSGNLLN